MIVFLAILLAAGFAYNGALQRDIGSVLVGAAIAGAVAIWLLFLR